MDRGSAELDNSVVTAIWEHGKQWNAHVVPENEPARKRNLKPLPAKELRKTHAKTPHPESKSPPACNYPAGS